MYSESITCAVHVTSPTLKEIIIVSQRTVRNKLKIHTAERRPFDPNLSPPLCGVKILCKFIFKTQVFNKSVCAGSQQLRPENGMSVLLCQILELCAISSFFIQNQETYMKAYEDTI